MKRNYGVCLLVIAVMACAHAAWGQLASSSWPKFHKDYSSTGVGIFGGTSSNLSWTFSTGGKIRSSPVVGTDGTVYVTSTNGNLYAVDGAGNQKWSVYCNCSGESSPAVGKDGVIYVASNDNCVYWIRPDGSTQWKKQVGAQPTTSVAMGNTSDAIYVGCANGMLYSFQKGGGLNWTAPFKAGGAIRSTPAIGSDGTIYFGSEDKKVYALTKAGALKWKAPFVGSGPFYGSPTLGTDGTVYIATTQNAIYAIDGSTGTQKWQKPSGGVVHSSPAIYNNSMIYYGCQDGKMHAITTLGVQKQAFEPGSMVESSPAVGSDGGIYVACVNGMLYALNPDRTKRWEYDLGSAIYSSPALGPGGSLLIGADDGVLYCFGADSSAPGAPVVTDDGDYTGQSTSLHASWNAADSDSGIQAYEYCIGTAPGLSDVAPWLNVGGKTEDTRTGLTLHENQMYYFTVRAYNGAGIQGASASSDGIMLDASGPTKPVVLDDGAFSANNTQIHASWSSADPESGIGRYEFSIGTTAGATNVLAWTDAGTATEVTRANLTLQQGVTYFVNVRAYNIVGGVSAVGSSDGIMIDTATPPAPVVTDDGKFTGSLTTLHATWTAVTSVSGVAGYEYSIGTTAGGTSIRDWTSVGLQTSVNDNSLTLINGTTYFINVRARSTVGKAGNVGSSDGIMVDTTPPTAPTVTDEGPYTSSTKLLSVTWSASDPESGIAEYFYAVGTTPGGTDARTWTSAGTQTTTVITSLAMLEGKKYYVSIKAKNGAGVEGAAGTTDGIIVDTTPPSTPVVTDDGAYTMKATELHAKWSASDAQSGILKYEYSIGTAAGATDILPWTDAGTTTDTVIKNLNLQSGLKYFVNVRATNGARTVSSVGSSDGIYVESTPPTTPVVTDDGDFTRDTTRLHAEWSTEDPETGVAKCEYSVGTQPGTADVIPWTDAGTATSMEKTNLTLQQGITYYVNVRATNGIGMLSEVGSSDGITVDNTPPSAAKVTDNGEFTADNTQLHAIVESEDADSGIASYECAVGTTPGGTDIADWQNIGSGPDAYIPDLQLQDGVIYYISAHAINGAGITGPAGVSDGIKVDSSAPVNVTVTDDGVYTGFDTKLHGKWNASDPESGIVAYKYCIGTEPGLDDVAEWVQVGPEGEDTREGLSLTSGQMYYITVVAVNAAGGESEPVSSDGILLDLTPPSMPVVTDNGKYWGYKTYMPASWTATDPESGIAAYRVSIGTAPGATDVKDWVEVGLATSDTIKDLQLKDGITYYVNVQAKNGAGVWGQTGSSDGILLDSTPPTTPVVTDDGDGTLMTDRLHGKWHSEDPESGIAEYMYCIGTSPGATDVTPWTSAGTVDDMMVTNLKLEPMLTYYFSVKARSNSGAWSAVSASDGIQYSTGAAIWWKFRNSASNAGRQDYKGTRVTDLAWRIDTMGYVESSPAIASDGTTYIGSGDGKLYAITQNGTIRWAFDAGSAIDSSPAVASNGDIVVGSNSGKLYCLNPAGEVMWVYSANGPVRSSPLINGNRVYVGSNDHFLHAVNLQTGLKEWTFKTGDAIWSSPACDKEGTVYFASGDSYIYAVKSDGTLKWKYLTGSATDASPAIADDGTVYIGSGDAYFYAVKPDGTLKWTYDAQMFCDSSAAIGPDGNIYFGAGFDGGNGKLFALKPDGTKLWSTSFPNGGIISSPAIDSTGMIFVGSSDEKIYAINPDGTICWSYKTLSSVASSPAIGADSSVVFGSYDGSIYCLRDIKAKDLTPPTTPVVTVPAVLGVGQPLTASWIATDPDTMVAEYTYAIGTAPGASDVSYWASTGIGTGVTRDDLILEAGKTYYVSVKARNPSQRWSEVGVSRGITVLSGQVVNEIAVVKKLADQTGVNLYGKAVGSVFDDCFFVQEANRSAGIKCAYTGTKPAPGDIVNITGTVSSSNGDKVLTGVTYTKTGSGPAPSPLGLAGKVRKGMQPDPFGITVRMWGKVTSAGPGYCVIGGQTGPLPAGTITGIEIRSADLAVAKGDFVVADGVLCSEKIGEQLTTVLRVPSAQSVSIHR